MYSFVLKHAYTVCKKVALEGLQKQLQVAEEALEDMSSGNLSFVMFSCSLFMGPFLNLNVF